LQVPGGLALSNCEKAEALADSLEAQFQPVDHPTDPEIEMLDEAMGASEYAPASEPTLAKLSEALQVIRGLRVRKDPGPNGIPSRFLRHVPKRATAFLAKVFNAALQRQYFPSGRKHARVVSILKLGRNIKLPSSYRPVSIVDRAGKPSEKILLTRVL
jgi:hypothetical protein